MSGNFPLEGLRKISKFLLPDNKRKEKNDENIVDILELLPDKGHLRETWRSRNIFLKKRDIRVRLIIQVQQKNRLELSASKTYSSHLVQYL